MSPTLLFRISCDNQTDGCQTGRMFVDWHNVRLQSVCLSCDSHDALVFTACMFSASDCLSPADHLSHLYILVMCASCTNSGCLWECVLHWCLRKGLAPLSGGRHWQASKMRHHCSCLQHSAKSREAATEAHDVRLSCQKEIVNAESSGSWRFFARGRWRVYDDYLTYLTESAGLLTQFSAENAEKRQDR